LSLHATQQDWAHGIFPAGDVSSRSEGLLHFPTVTFSGWQAVARLHLAPRLASYSPPPLAAGSGFQESR